MSFSGRRCIEVDANAGSGIFCLLYAVLKSDTFVRSFAFDLLMDTVKEYGDLERRNN